MAELHKIDCEPQGNGIDALFDELRTRYDNGEISSVAVAIVHRDGTCDYLNSFCPSYTAIIGAIERMKYRIVMEAETD
jgi:hypothetical protein